MQYAILYCSVHSRMDGRLGRRQLVFLRGQHEVVGIQTDKQLGRFRLRCTSGGIRRQIDIPIDKQIFRLVGIVLQAVSVSGGRQVCRKDRIDNQVGGWLGYLSLCQEVGGEHQDSQKDVAGWHPEAAVSLKQKNKSFGSSRKKETKNKS